MTQKTLINNNLILNLNSFYQLMKPRVMSLVIFTCVVGLLISPSDINFFTAIISLLAVAIGAGASGALNMWYESDLDAIMQRTCLRPIPTGKISRNHAFFFGIFASFFSVLVLYFFSNLLSAIILAFTIFFYVVIYTIWLTRRTAQNIVIGGAAGAFPPLIGWTIGTNSISLEPILLFLIIFFWTPSHFWALSIFKSQDYQKAKIPMLPVIAGIKNTKINIFVYALILFIVSILPFVFGFSTILYLGFAVVLGIYYIYLCYKLLINDDTKKDDSKAKKIFLFSILYLFLIFIVILIDNII